MDNKEKAFIDWRKGTKQKDIAEKYGVTVSAVKSWVSRDFKHRGATSTKEKVATKPKKVATKGAPKGNKNAVGNRGNPQPRNQNNYKHGAYAKVYWDTLDEDELALLEEMPIDEEENLMDQIRLLSIRERRLMKEIKNFKEKAAGLTVDSVTKRVLEIKGDVASQKEQKQDETTTKTTSSFDVVLRLEAELSKVQTSKTKALNTLHKIRSDHKDREEREQELGANAVEDVIIYMPEKRDIE